MTREQAKQNLIGLGVAEPTDENITNYLNQIGSETKKEKDRADALKSKADKADELQTQIDDMNNQKLSEVEKATKALEQANNKIAELERKDAIRNSRSLAMEKFKITAEQSVQVVKDDGSFDYDALGQIISEKESAAAIAKEKEIRDNSGNPGGANGGNDPTQASKGAEMAQKFNQSNTVKL